MKTEITRDFTGAEDKGLKVFYNESLGNFDIETPVEVISIYDNDGAIKKVQKFIDEFQ